MTSPKWSVGSRWLRWDPHLHAPGTLRNDQFGHDWDGYIRAIEEATPAPVALGITDYFTLRGYKEVLKRKKDGALSRVPLLFPNVEIRLTVETRDRAPINLHLLVSPEDPDHVSLIEEKLAQLTFTYESDVIPCKDDGLIRLGRAHRHDQSLADGAALREGANQFKVDLGKLRDIYKQDPWLQSNVLIAVSSGNDGLAGLSQDASFHALREEIGRFAHIIFSGNPKERAFWAGGDPRLRANGQPPRPCLHGCDAHTIETVLNPDEGRLCWLRAEPTFDGLRQALVEPERRVHIGEAPPRVTSPGDVIKSLQVKNAPWFNNETVELNDGLVTIIGERGSGKTALADLLASAAHAEEDEPGPASFLGKAMPLVRGLEMEIEWGDGQKERTRVGAVGDFHAEPRVRYLSQQFVERLCSPKGLAEPLVEEIERVVFSAIPEEDRLQCARFDELRAVMLRVPAADRANEEEAIKTQTRRIAEEAGLIKSLPELKGIAEATRRNRANIEIELKSMPLKVDDEKVKIQQACAGAVKALQDAIAEEERRMKDIGEVIAGVQRQIRQASESLAALQAQHPDLLPPDVWDRLRLRPPDDAIPSLEALRAVAQARARRLRDTGAAEESASAAGTKGLAALVAENERLEKALGLDRAKAKRRAELDGKLTRAKKEEEDTRKKAEHASKASDRRRTAQVERLASYERVFEALLAEERTLEGLYSPLRERIKADTRLEKLSFVVERTVDLEAWSARGEALMDLRRPPFQRRGAVADAARERLLDAWARSSPQDVRSAMEEFIEKHAKDAAEALAQGVTMLDFGEWLFSTDHIRVRYGIRYEGVELGLLSQGTRGVVLLTLYLALDEWDDRPLIIDQPEENLDPRSVYSELVPFFRDAARRRQIIMVTHNANLVVNADSDQVIVAEAHRRAPSELPVFRYLAGGLEDPAIRDQVCSLLEGGEEAFRRRGQRYGWGGEIST